MVEVCLSTTSGNLNSHMKLPGTIYVLRQPILYQGILLSQLIITSHNKPMQKTSYKELLHLLHQKPNHKNLHYKWNISFSYVPLDNKVKSDWQHQWTQGPYPIIILHFSQKQNKNLLLPLSILLPPEALLILWVLWFRGWHPRQLWFHLKFKLPRMQA